MGPAISISFLITSLLSKDVIGVTILRPAISLLDIVFEIVVVDVVDAGVEFESD